MASPAVIPEYDKVVKTVCKMCYIHCGIDAFVKDGKLIAVTGSKGHPLNKGEICPKAEQAVAFVYSPDRLKYPQKRVGKRGDGKWQRITWDEALDTIAGKLKEFKTKYGESSLIYLTGDPTGMIGPMGAGLGFRFCDIYGTPYRSGVDAICYEVRGKAALSTVGKFQTPDAEFSQCIILWGHNPTNSLPPFTRLIDHALMNDAKLIVVDPRKTIYARKANIHLQPRPGTDSALALAMVDTIIKEGLYDKEFVDKWTFGFNELAERASQYPAEKVEKTTWVPAEQIKAAARLYASNKPACIVQGTNTLDQQASGFQTNRLFLILQGLTGNIDNPGGNIRVSGNIKMSPFRLPELIKGKIIGADKFPITSRLGNTNFLNVQSMEWADIVLSGKPPIKFCIVQGTNPIVTWPNSNKTRKALESMEYLVVMDPFMTETGQMADMVLPASTFLEETYITVSSARLVNAPYAMMCKEAIAPLFESWPDWKFWFELAKKMGYEKYFPWKTQKEYLEYLMKPMEGTEASLEKLWHEHPEGVVFGAKEYNEYKEKGFRTPSGKLEFYSQALKGMGMDPLPYFEENPETPVSDPELAKEYPLVLTTGARMLEYWHSLFRNVPELRARTPEPHAEINPETAKKYGVKDGDNMVVETKRGSMEIKANVTSEIMPGVVLMPHGWAKHNVNLLTDNRHVDKVSGYPALKGVLCRIKKKK